MIDGENLFIIPARGGSKRLPRKNVLPLAGKPLITWTIEAALRCGIEGEICVSTDDEETAEIAVKAGASVPFIRPAELSSDQAGSAAVVKHAIDFYSHNGKTFINLILLQPTSPLRDAADIRGAFDFFRERNAKNVVSVCPMDHSPLWSNVLPDNLSLKGFIKKEVKGRRSQDLPVYYRLNGAIYICDIDRFRKTFSLINEDEAFAYIMSAEHSIDIDTLIDVRLAELILDSRV